MEVRYVVQDVSADPRLRPLALDYLSKYNGEFMFLRLMRNNMTDGATLSNAQIKGILNCMLSDPQVVNMPIPVHKVFDAAATLDPFNEYPVIERPKTKYMQQKLHRFITELNTPFGTSLHTRTEKIHFVRTPIDAWMTNYDTIRFMASWGCTGRIPEERAALLTHEQAVELIMHGDRRYCPQCESVSELKPTITSTDSGSGTIRDTLRPIRLTLPPTPKR